MENLDHISFEQASAELLEKVHHTLSAFRQRFEGEDVDFAKLHRELVKRVNDELDVLPCHPEVVEVRPKVLDCDVVRFQNNKDKWVALIGLLDGHPYEIFTGLLDDEEGIMLPKSVMKGRIVKEVNNDGTKRYDFQFFNKRGYKMTIEGLSERFNPEYWNYAKLIYGMNSIVAYMLGEVINFRSIVRSVSYGLEPLLGAQYETWLTFGNGLILFGILRWMYRQQMFVKV